MYGLLSYSNSTTQTRYLFKIQNNFLLFYVFDVVYNNMCSKPYNQGSNKGRVFTIMSRSKRWNMLNKKC